jgi:hypothetical protein
MGTAYMECHSSYSTDMNAEARQGVIRSKISPLFIFGLDRYYLHVALCYLRRPNFPFAPPLAPFAVLIFSLRKFAWADALIFRPAVLTTPSFG